MTTIGITGAAGGLGRRAAHFVLASHSPSGVVLFSRSPHHLAELTELGADARTADFDRPDALAEAFTGVDVLLLISTDAVGRRAEQHRAAITAATAAGVQRIAYTSMPNPHQDFPDLLRPVARDHAATEDALRGAGPAWTILRNSLYFDNQAAAWAQAAATGTLLTNNGAGRQAGILREDCAAAAAAVLLTDGHDGAIYDVTGPRLLDDDAVAAALARRYGREITVEHLSDADYVEALTAAGLPVEIASVTAGFGAATRQGLLETPVGDTERLIGHAPRDIDDHLAALAGDPQ